MEQRESQSAIAAEGAVGNRCRIVCSAFTAKHASVRLSCCVAALVFLGSLILTSSSSFAWQRLAAIAKSAPNLSPIPDEGGSTSIAELIDSLNSPAFSQRQSATDSIIKYGVSALPDLSRRFFDSSPETNYRIRKALEGIAATGDEETFLKSSAILLTLYSNGNEHIFQQIEALKEKWQTQRTEFAIAALKRTGAEVIQQKGYNNGQFARRSATIRAIEAAQVAGSKNVKYVKRTVLEQKEMVETILASNAKSNRDFIFEIMPVQPRANRPVVTGAAALNLPYLVGTKISFPADWAVNNADASALQQLREIDDRLVVKFANTNLSNTQWKTLADADNVLVLDITADEESARIPSTLPASLQLLVLTGYEIDNGFVDSIQRSKHLQQLELVNCEFDQILADRIDKIESIKSIVCRFENCKLDADIVLAMAKFRDVRAVNLTAVEFSDAALHNMRRLANVSLLYVSDMPATSRFFENVGAMPRLNSIQFRGCKLDIPAYKRLDSAQRVRMSFEAQAFLGIQGSGAMAGRPMGASALVSMVVPDSAAEAGGIKPGDLIAKIDGEKVNDFNDVRLHITQYSAGDEVDIEVLRNGKPESLKVKLRDYKTARKF